MKCPYCNAELNDNAFIYSLGRITESGNCVSNDDVGIRPALWVDLNS